jgi:hypothetical protein
MERVAMRAAITLASLIVFFISVVGNEWHGKTEEELFTVSYKQDERKVYIDRKKERVTIVLSGYAATDFYIRDIDGDGNDEILFLDQAGASVGGELRLFRWDSGKAVEIDEEYYANKITIKKLNKKHFLMLWQHDTDNLYYCSEVLSLQKGGLLKEASHMAWDGIIMDYRKSVASEKSNWRKSRYYAYMAMAYQNLGNKTKADQFFTKAKRLDTANPFVNRGLRE